MTDPLQAFCEKWFPITVRHARTDVDMRTATVEWFGGAAVAQSYPFVVRAWLHFDFLKDPAPPGAHDLWRKTVACGYDALIVEITEHGVGKLVEEWFPFEKFLSSRLLPPEPHGDLSAWQKFFVQAGSPPGASLTWHCFAPANIRELLDPVERYIELWLSENPAAAGSAFHEQPRPRLNR